MIERAAAGYQAASQSRSNAATPEADQARQTAASTTMIRAEAVDEFTLGVAAGLVETLNAPDIMADGAPRSRKLRAYTALEAAQSRSGTRRLA